MLDYDTGSFALSDMATKMHDLTAKKKNPMHRIGPQQEHALAKRQHIPITLPKAPWEK